MLIAQHPLMEGKELAYLLLIAFGIYFAFQVTAFLLLPGKWKLLALPGLLCPMMTLLLLNDEMPSIGQVVILTSWVYTVGLGIVAILYGVITAIIRTARPAGHDVAANRKPLK